VLRGTEGGEELRSAPVLTGPKVKSTKRLAPGDVLPLGTSGFTKRGWLADRRPIGDVAGAYHAWSTFNCRRLDYGHLNLRITSGEARLEIK
jgi:hypothetical protein